MILVCLVGIIFIMRLYHLQIVNGASFLEQSEKRLVREVEVPAPRGEIYDRYGKPLVTNETAYDVCIYYTKIGKKELNHSLYKISQILEKNGDKYINNFPIDFSKMVFTKGEESIREWKKEFGLPTNCSVQDAISYFQKRFEMEDEEEPFLARVIPLRYEISTKGYTSYKSVTLASDISESSMLEIEERNNEFSGISLAKHPKRKYLTGTVASHIIGYMGAISSSEYESKKNEGYSMNDSIGKTGIEATFEERLRGENGKDRLAMDSKGRITESTTVDESKMGDSIVLTIDIDLQKKSEEVLEKYIHMIQSGGYAEKFADATAGAIVVLDVKTAEVLALASYPNYNPSDLSDGITNKEFEAYFQNEDRPMFNRAIQGTYSPGSTFKMVTTIAALESGAIGVDDIVVDRGRYDKGHKPVCWIWSDYGSTHGAVNALKALKVSCNYYFYEVSYRMGIDKLSEYARKFGLGSKTGIELLGEVRGTLASKEYMNSLTAQDGKERTWMIADTLSAGIGQSYNSFTPIQMAYYIATIANGGVKNQLSIIKDVISSNGEEVSPSEYRKTVTSKTGESEIQTGDLHISPEVMQAVFEGMRSVTSDRGGTAYSTFSSFPIEVAGKTGTATAGSGSPNAWFVGFAPYDNPQIAVVCVIEHGGHGGYTAPVVKEVMEEYFGYNNDNINENIELKSLNDIIR